jgi:hypothetical protein
VTAIKFVVDRGMFVGARAGSSTIRAPASNAGCGNYGASAMGSRRERKKGRIAEEQMNTTKISRTDHWMKWARDSWVAPFMAGTLGGFFMFWI